MRTMVLGCALLLPVAAFAQDMTPPQGAPREGVSHQGPPHQGEHHWPGRGAPPSRSNERLFISPMGEPFRSVKGEPEPQEMWFAEVDTNHDNAISRAEFQADAMRFFVTMDRKHQGEIDPDDIEYYETVLVPEIRVSQGGFGGIEGGGSGEGATRIPYPERQGAGRFSYFSFPEPITAADSNFNRGVSAEEFRRAADSRFDVLDINGDGKIDKAELPKIAAIRAEDRRGGGSEGGGRKRGGGRRGGMGGGMGGGGMGDDDGMGRPGGGLGQP